MPGKFLIPLSSWSKLVFSFRVGNGMWNAANEAGELGVESRSLRNCLGGGELAYSEKGIEGVCGEKEELPWA